MGISQHWMGYGMVYFSPINQSISMPANCNRLGTRILIILNFQASFHYQLHVLMFPFLIYHNHNTFLWKTGLLHAFVSHSFHVLKLIVKHVKNGNIILRSVIYATRAAWWSPKDIQIASVYDSHHTRVCPAVIGHMERYLIGIAPVFGTFDSFCALRSEYFAY